MLGEILTHLHNWFVAYVIKDAFVISNGQLVMTADLNIKEGQYYRIMGSVFNDGLHKHPETDLHDEVFKGEIWLLAVPPALVALSEEIAKWQADNAAILASPYTSESFGGYSYSKPTASGASGDTGALTWQNQFRTRLNPYRKMPLC